MSETKFTPGPWTVVDREVMEGSSVYPMHILGGVTRLQVCLMEDMSVAYEIVKNPNWHHMTKSPMKLANAHLISSAPELYHELEMQVANCPVCKGTGIDKQEMWGIVSGASVEPEDCRRCSGARKALSKARGES